VASVIPSADGELNQYNLSHSQVQTPRIYFVNGVRVMPRDHAITASYLSLLIERPVWGLYNKTGIVKLGSILGSGLDFLQCLPDYAQNAGARLFSASNLNKPARVPEHQIASFLNNIERNFTIWNKATAALFKDLVLHRHQMKYIIAHSQGNLITSNALFVMEDILGSAALQKVRVYSLASPSPAWPLGLRITHGGGGRQDNAFMNDFVALLRPHNLARKVGIKGLQNAGDFRTHPDFGPVHLGPHDTHRIIETLNFLKSIRSDLGLSKDFPDAFLKDCARKAEEAFPGELK
jgi:hypothetical protein